MGLEDTTAPTTSTGMDRRSDYHPLRWILLSGNRLMLALLLSLLILVALLTVGTLLELEMETLVDETRAVQSLFNTLLGGIILFVSVVLSINTAVLAQEFAPLGTKQVQIEESMEFRTELEEFAESAVSPPELSGFLLFLLQLLRDETGRLHEATTDQDEAERGKLLAFIDGIEEEMTLVEKRIRSPSRGLSALLLAGMDYDVINHIYTAQRLQSEYSTNLSRGERESLTNLIELLKSFASGREYFKTLYYQREVRALSSSLLFLALPVIVFTSYVLLAIDAGQFPAITILEIQPRLLFISVAFVITLSPYVLLSAYMLRIVTVSKHSLGSSGFTLPGAGWK